MIYTICSVTLCAEPPSVPAAVRLRAGTSSLPSLFSGGSCFSARGLALLFGGIECCSSFLSGILDLPPALLLNGFPRRPLYGALSIFTFCFSVVRFFCLLRRLLFLRHDLLSLSNAQPRRRGVNVKRRWRSARRRLCRATPLCPHGQRCRSSALISGPNFRDLPVCCFPHFVHFCHAFLPPSSQMATKKGLIFNQPAGKVAFLLSTSGQIARSNGYLCKIATRSLIWVTLYLVFNGII